MYSQDTMQLSKHCSKCEIYDLLKMLGRVAQIKKVLKPKNSLRFFSPIHHPATLWEHFEK